MYSIIVPIYKVEAYLSKCIESILSQTFNDFELILVDDGSPDGCSAICDDFAKKDSRIKVVHKKNGGLVSARKAGLEISSGEYICFVDGDDFLKEDMLETFHKTVLENNVDIVCSCFSQYYDDEHIAPMIQRIPCGVYDKSALENCVYPHMLSVAPFYTFYVFPSLVVKCFKRSILERIYSSLPDELTLGEDAAVTYPALLEAARVSVIDYCGYMYRQNQSSMTHTYDKHLRDKIIKLIVHLKGVQAEKQWPTVNQFSDYVFFLLLLAKNNEFSYNFIDKYSKKKKNLLAYLDDDMIRSILNDVRVTKFKNRLLLTCFKRKILFPLYIIELIRRKR